MRSEKSGTDPAIKRAALVKRQSKVSLATRPSAETVTEGTGHGASCQTIEALTKGGVMDNKPRPKSPRDSTWDEQDRITNPDKRQDEDEEINKESQRRGQRATNTPGSSESAPTDRRDDIPGGRHYGDPSRKHQTEE
jgi:hypothetical protein